MRLLKIARVVLQKIVYITARELFDWVYFQGILNQEGFGYYCIQVRPGYLVGLLVQQMK